MKKASFLLLCLVCGLFYSLSQNPIVISNFRFQGPVTFARAQDNSTSTEIENNTSTENSTVTNDSITINTNENGTDYVPFLSNPVNVAVLISVICLFFFYIVIQSLELYKHPSIIVADELTMRRVYLGRFLDEEREDKLRLWKMRFKTYSGIQVIYSETSFSEFNIVDFEKFAQIWWFLPMLVLCKRKFDGSIEISSEKMVKNFTNYCRKIVGIILNAFQLRLLAVALFKAIQYQKEKVTEIKFITPIYLKEQLDITAEVEYTRKDEIGKDGKKSDVFHGKEIVPWVQTKTLPEDPNISDFKANKILVNDKLKIANIDDAKKNFVSRITERAIFKIKCLEYERINDENYMLYKSAEEQLIDHKLAQEKEVDTNLKRFIDKSDVFRKNIYDVLEGTFGLSHLGAKVEEAATNNVEKLARTSLDKNQKLSDKIESLDNERRRLLTEIEQLKAQQKGNELTFRPGFSVEQKKPELSEGNG